ncbi:MAG: aminopeptidase P family N-terminal domain-containing protein, partial [Micromonosporaceae bacterium]
MTTSRILAATLPGFGPQAGPSYRILPTTDPDEFRSAQGLRHLAFADERRVRPGRARPLREQLVETGRSCVHPDHRRLAHRGPTRARHPGPGQRHHRPPDAYADGVVTQFTAQDYADRMRRAVDAAAAEGFAGLLIAAGPDLAYFTGYPASTTTERLTLLVLMPGRKPAMIVPRLEKGDAQRAPGAPALTLVDWADGADPYATTADLLDPSARY